MHFGIREIYTLYYEETRTLFLGGIIMRFREFREVERNIEKEKMNEKKKEEGFRKIKPETDITFEEAEAFWKEVFASVRES